MVLVCQSIAARVPLLYHFLCTLTFKLADFAVTTVFLPRRLCTGHRLVFASKALMGPFMARTHKH